MWDDHLTQVEVRGEVKGFPKHVREGSQIDNLEMIGKRGGGGRNKKVKTVCGIWGSVFIIREFLQSQQEQSTQKRKCKR